MTLEKFSLETIAEMDGGRIRAAFQQALQRLEADCKDRPALKKQRELSLVMCMTPVPEGTDLDSVNVTFKIKESIPKRESKSYNMQVVRGGLIYNDASLEDVKQMTLDMAPRPERQVETGSRKDRTGEEVSDVG